MMHPDYRLDVIHERQHELEQALEHSGRIRGRGERDDPAEEAVVLRLCTVHDHDALEELALYEARTAPSGRFVVAEVGGRIVAALPLAGGKPLTDPFRPTDHLLPLLRLRAEQLAAHPRPRIETAKAIAARVLHPAR